MTFTRLLDTFRGDGGGAATIDWVVLTAACIGLGVAALAAMSGGPDASGGKITQKLEDAPMAPSFGTGHGTTAPD